MADEALGDNMLLSWCDRERVLERRGMSANVIKVACPINGCRDYALNRGAALAEDFDDGRFLFCFMPLA